MRVDSSKLDATIRIAILEEKGEINPNCKTCQSIYYPHLKDGKDIWSIFAPRHKPSNMCQSGKRPHCTCDTCF